MNKGRIVLGGTLVATIAACGSVLVTPSGEDAGTLDAGQAGADSGAGAGPTEIDAASDAAPDSPPDAPFKCEAEAGLPAPDAGCPVVDPNSFGACELSGWSGFDGKACVGLNGCLPAGPPFPPGVFGTQTDCAFACGMAGKCDESKLGIGFQPGMPIEGTSCDDIAILLSPDDAVLQAICAMLGPISCEPQPDGKVRCKWSGYHFDHFLSADGAGRVCALSLIGQVEQIACWVYL